jgi:sarcosine oxidase subunit beta
MVQMNNTADIVIIGGGITGVSTGYFLLKNGAKNIVSLERDHLATGSTGRCGAGIRQQWGSPLNCVLSKFSCDFYENAAHELEYENDMEFHQKGYLLLFTTENEIIQAKTNIELQNSLGIHSKLLSPQEVKDIAPIINTDLLVGAAYHSKDGFINPFHTTYAFANAFRRLGGKIFTNTAVTDIKHVNGKITSVSTNKGEISTETVVIATGGYSQQVAAMVGCELPLYSERHNILATEPVEPILEPMLMSFSLNFYCQQTPHGSFLMGRHCENQPRDLRVTACSNFPAAMAKTITNIAPPLKNLRVLRQWAGLYNMSPDKHPIYDKLPGFNGLYLSAGFSGHGFMMGPATGKCMTEIILNKKPTLPWNQLGLARFKHGEQLVEPLVV